MFTLHLYPCTLTAFYFFEWIITLVIYSVAPLSGHSVGAHASWLLYHFLQDPIIFWLLHCFLAQNVLESSWTFSWEPEAISPRGQEVPRSGAKRNYCSQAFSVDTHTDVCTISPCGHPPHPAWHLSPLTGPIPTPTPTMPTANEQLMSQTPGRRSTLRPFLSEVKEQGWQRVALQGVWPGAGGAVHSFPGRVDFTFPNCREGDGQWLRGHSGVTRCQRAFSSLGHTGHMGLMTFIIWPLAMSPWRLTRGPEQGGHASPREPWPGAKLRSGRLWNLFLWAEVSALVSSGIRGRIFKIITWEERPEECWAAKQWTWVELFFLLSISLPFLW